MSDDVFTVIGTDADGNIRSTVIMLAIDAEDAAQRAKAEAGIEPLAVIPAMVELAWRRP